MRSKPAKGFDRCSLGRTPCCLAIILQGAFLGRLVAEPNIRITDLVWKVSQKIRDGFSQDRWTMGLPEDTSRGAHRLFLESILKEGLVVGTLQGPLPQFSRLSGYVWEETKLLFLIPSRRLAGGNATWWDALQVPHPSKEAPPVEGLGPSWPWRTPGPIAAGMVVLVHSLETAKHLNGQVAMVLKRVSDTGRFAIRLRDFSAFNGATVQVKPLNVSLLWWGHLPADWPSRHLNRARALGPRAAPGVLKAGDKVLVQSIEVGMRGIQVNSRLPSPTHC